jgi:hypothetical protein
MFAMVFINTAPPDSEWNLKTNLFGDTFREPADLNNLLGLIFTQTGIQDLVVKSIRSVNTISVPGVLAGENLLQSVGDSSFNERFGFSAIHDHRSKSQMCWIHLQVFTNFC